MSYRQRQLADPEVRDQPHVILSRISIFRKHQKQQRQSSVVVEHTLESAVISHFEFMKPEDSEFESRIKTREEY